MIPIWAKKIDAAIIPGLQGGPHNATTAGIAIAAAEAATPAFKRYAKQIRKNADALAKALQKQGLQLVGDGTETHLMVIDLTQFGIGLGTQVAYAMDAAGIYANRNTVPTEQGSPFYPSGVRIGTPLVTTRGMKEPQMRQIAKWIAQVAKHVTAQQLPKDRKERTVFLKAFRKSADKDPVLFKIKREVKTMTANFPLFAW